jgi:uncharacterized protein YggT (Ycf19 family)
MNRDQNDETNLERRQDLRHDEEVFRLNQEERRLRSAKQNTILTWIIKSIFWIAGTLEILLLMRFLLRLFGANRENAFAQLINNLSAPFMAPFSSLFSSPTSSNGGNIFDINILLAILAYALLSYLIVSLIRLIFGRKT